jgi:hypothetical protein
MIKQNRLLVKNISYGSAMGFVISLLGKFMGTLPHNMANELSAVDAMSGQPITPDELKKFRYINYLQGGLSTVRRSHSDLKPTRRGRQSKEETLSAEFLHAHKGLERESIVNLHYSNKGVTDQTHIIIRSYMDGEISDCELEIRSFGYFIASLPESLRGPALYKEKKSKSPEIEIDFRRLEQERMAAALDLDRLGSQYINNQIVIKVHDNMNQIVKVLNRFKIFGWAPKYDHDENEVVVEYNKNLANIMGIPWM